MTKKGLLFSPQKSRTISCEVNFQCETQIKNVKNKEKIYRNINNGYSDVQYTTSAHSLVCTSMKNSTFEPGFEDIYRDPQTPPFSPAGLHMRSGT
jgi:hypothetical protein